MTRPRLLAAGAAHIDRRGRVSGAYVPGASNPGSLREEVGGGAFNALRNAVRHGVEGALLSLRGGDPAGDAVAAAIASAGIEDLSCVFLDRTTPSYTALIERDGELIAGLADMEIYEIGFERQMRRRRLREAVAAADGVLIDANMPAAAITRLVKLAAAKPLFAVAISPAKAGRLAPVLGDLSCLFMNRREAVALGAWENGAAVDAARALQARGLRRGAISAGDEALLGFDGDDVFAIAPPRLDAIADVTGAGDALAGVASACLLHGLPFREALRHGIAAAALTVARPVVVADYDDVAFAAALALVGQPQAVA